MYAASLFGSCCVYTVVASNFKLKKSTDKALVCLYEIYFICVIHLINWGLFKNLVLLFDIFQFYKEMCSILSDN